MSAPESLDLTACAAAVLELERLSDSDTYPAHLDVWQELTGLRDEAEALAYAAQVAAAVPPITAHVPPM